MHYYQFHIGDYASHTRHLSLYEDLAYRRLLDFYYLHEQPIKQRDIARQIGMRDQEQDVLTVLNEFFLSTEDGFINPRADEEIRKYKEFIEAGKRGAAKRWAKAGHGEAISPHNAGLIPTINHKPITKDISMSESVPTIPFDQLIDLYEKHLPELPSVRKSLFSTGTNAKSTKQRWDWVMSSTHEKGPRAGQRLAETQEQALEWFDKFFGFVSQSDFLTGRDKKWSGCNLGWLMNRANFEKVLSGQYHKKD